MSPRKILAAVLPLSTLLWANALGAAADPAPVIQRIAGPTAGPAGGELAIAAHKAGPIHLAWTEAGALKVAAFDRRSSRWSESHTFAGGEPSLAGAETNAETISLAAGPSGSAALAWSQLRTAGLPPATVPDWVGQPRSLESALAAVNLPRLQNEPDYGFRVSWTSNGLQWSAPQDGAPVKSNPIPRVAFLADGGLLVAWREVRESRPVSVASLEELALARTRALQGVVHSRILRGSDRVSTDAPLSVLAPDAIVQSSLTAFPDGSALFAGQAHLPGLIHLARYEGGRWQRLSPLTTTSAVSAPAYFTPRLTRLASSGPRVSLLWSQPDLPSPRLYLASSGNAGITFSEAERVDLGNPVGDSGDVVVLRDGTQVVSWIERKTSAWGEILPDGANGVYLKVIPASSDSALGPARILPEETLSLRRVRIAVWSDETGAAQRLLLAGIRSGANGGLEVYDVTLPHRPASAAEAGCGCDLTPEQQAGYPIRGRITAIPAGQGTLRVRLPAVAGLFPAGETEFRAAPELIAAVEAGRDILGRVEQRGEDWWIFDVGLLSPALR